MRQYMLNYLSLCDLITVLNFKYSGQTVKVSQRWFAAIVSSDLWHDCYFDIEVSNHRFTPVWPEPIINS